jgi:PAS domain S-box-containing protein
MAAVLLGSLVPFVVVRALGATWGLVVGGPAFLLIHNATEFLSIVASFSIFGIGWYGFAQSRDRYTLALAAAFFALGLLDAMHTLAYDGVPPLLAAGFSDNASLFGVATRMFTALAFLASAWIHHDSSSRWLSKPALMAGALAVPAAVFGAVTFYAGQLPAAFVPGGMTPFGNAAEAASIPVLLAAIVAYRNRIRRGGERALHYMVAALVLCIVAEMALVVRADVMDSYTVFAHLYRVTAFVLVYRGVFSHAVSEPYAALRDEMAERLQAEENASRSRRLLDETYALAKVGGWEYDLRTHRLAWTDEIYRIYGVPRETDPTSLLGRSFHPPGDQERVTEAFRRAREEGQPYDVEVRLDNLRGERLWVRTIGQVERQGGRIVRVYGNIVDVTERKNAELELEQYFRLFLTSADLMGIADPQGAFKKVNPAFMATLGWKEEEILSRPFMEFVHPEDRESTAAEMARQGERGYSLDFENRYLCADGSVRWLSWRAHVSRADGLTYATARDITAQRRAAENLARQTDELQHRNHELEVFNEAMVGRELTMIRLKEEVNGLARELGREPPYPMDLFPSVPGPEPGDS